VLLAVSCLRCRARVHLAHLVWLTRASDVPCPACLRLLAPPLPQADLSKFVRLCFDYPLTGQVQEKVWLLLRRSARLLLAVSTLRYTLKVYKCRTHPGRANLDALVCIYHCVHTGVIGAVTVDVGR